MSKTLLFSIEEVRRTQALSMAIDAHTRAGFCDVEGVVQAAAEFEKYMRGDDEHRKPLAVLTEPGQWTPFGTQPI